MVVVVVVVPAVVGSSGSPSSGGNGSMRSWRGSVAVAGQHQRHLAAQLGGHARVVHHGHVHVGRLVGLQPVGHDGGEGPGPLLLGAAPTGWLLSGV